MKDTKEMLLKLAEAIDYEYDENGEMLIYVDKNKVNELQKENAKRAKAIH